MMNDGGKKMTKKRVKYMVQSIAIMAVATIFYFFFFCFCFIKKKIFMIYNLGGMVIKDKNTRFLYGIVGS